MTTEQLLQTKLTHQVYFDKVCTTQPHSSDKGSVSCVPLVPDERFEYARKLKAAQAQLHAAGERLARMTLDKRAAIAAEDYGRARTLKTTIDQLRDRLYKELAVSDLLEKGGVSRLSNTEYEAQRRRVT